MSIPEIIDEQIECLKPELKSKFVYRIVDWESNKYAETQYLVPPMITFYEKNIEKMIDKPIKQSIRELITHELVHVLQVPGFEHSEDEAVGRFQKLKFFKE